MAEKIFSYKKPIITFAIITICMIMFAAMYLFGNGSNDTMTLLNFGANLDILTKEGQYYRLFTSIFLHTDGYKHCPLHIPSFSCFLQEGFRKFAVGPPTSWIYPLKSGCMVSFFASSTIDS